MLESIRQAIARDRAARERHAETAALRARYASLTPREAEVMEWVVSGLLNKQIAGELGISEETVKVHRGHVMRKMEALTPWQDWSGCPRPLEYPLDGTRNIGRPEGRHDTTASVPPTCNRPLTSYPL